MSGSTSKGQDQYESKDGYKENIKTFTIANTLFEVHNRYEPGKVLGMGAYGVVITSSAILPKKKKKRKYAIKKILDWSGDWVDGLRILREVKLMRHFSMHRHKNLIHLVDLMASPINSPFNDIYVVMDLMDTDMNKIIYSKNKLTDQHYQAWIRATLKALRFMHSAGVVHRDLKPANLLLNKTCELKVCDYGLARGLGEELEKVLTEYVVTRWYRAPEIVCGCDYDEKIDVWALGCIFAEMIGRRPMFPGKDFRHQFELIIDCLGNPSESDILCIDNVSVQDYIRKMDKRSGKSFEREFPKASEGARDLLKQMLMFNPQRRISVEEALRHNWLRDPNRKSDKGHDVCSEQLDFSFENDENLPQLNRRKLEEAMWDLVRQVHPELPVKRRFNGHDTSRPVDVDGVEGTDDDDDDDDSSSEVTSHKYLQQWSKEEVNKWCSTHKYSNELLDVFKDMAGIDIIRMGRAALLQVLQIKGLSEMISKSIYREIRELKLDGSKTDSTTTTTTDSTTTTTTTCTFHSVSALEEEIERLKKLIDDAVKSTDYMTAAILKGEKDTKTKELEEAKKREAEAKKKSKKKVKSDEEKSLEKEYKAVLQKIQEAVTKEEYLEAANLKKDLERISARLAVEKTSEGI